MVNNECKQLIQWKCCSRSVRRILLGQKSLWKIGAGAGGSAGEEEGSGGEGAVGGAGAGGGAGGAGGGNHIVTLCW